MIEIANTPDFVCSGMFQPEYDFAGKQLQDLADTTRISDHIALNVIPTDMGGAVILSWVGELDTNKCLAQSLHNLSYDQIPNAVMRLAFEHLENTFAAPAWWDKLPATTQQHLLRRQMSGLSPLVDNRTNLCLVDDGIEAVHWSITSRRTNIV